MVLGLDDPVDIRVDGSRIMIEPAARPAPCLEDLLNAVTAENLHDEVEFGDRVGREAL